MKITQTLDGNKLKLELNGKLMTGNTDELENIINNNLTDIKELVLDLSNLEFVTSAGLKIFLNAHKKLKDKGRMILINANDMVLEIFRITGIIDILNIR